MGIIWTQERLDTLVREWPDHSASYIAQLIGRSRKAVAHQARKMNLIRKLPGIPVTWTTSRVEILTSHWLTHSTRSIAAMLGTSTGAITKKASMLRLGKKPFKITTTPWTDEKINRLKELWPLPDWSQSRIGEEIGMSAGAVAGKADRLKLPRKARSKPKIVRQPKQAAKPITKTMRAPLRAFELNQIATRVDLVAKLNIGLFDLQPFHCRWITGEADGLATYCGHNKAHRSYCAHHARIAFRPMNPYRKDMQRAA